jgi:hypothetical protein
MISKWILKIDLMLVSFIVAYLGRVNKPNNNKKLKKQIRKQKKMVQFGFEFRSFKPIELNQTRLVQPKN